MMMRNWVGFVAVAALIVACSDDEEPAKQPASVNKQAAASNAQSTITALASTQSGSGESAGQSSASGLAGVAQSSQSLLQAQPGTTGTQSIASALFVEGGVQPLDLNGPGCTCTATSCTFTNCAAGGSTGSGSFSFTVDGTYSWGGGHVECKNLKYTFDGSGSGAGGAAIGFSTNVVVTLTCDLTLTSSSLKGFLQSVGSSSTEIAGQNTQGAYSSSWDVKTTYNDVSYDSSKRATGGSVHVEGTTSVTAGGQTQSFAGAADVTFPAN